MSKNFDFERIKLMLSEKKGEKKPKPDKSFITKKQTDFDEIIERIRFVCSKDNLAYKTIECYQSVLRLFFKWLVKYQNIYFLKDITQEIFDNYIIYLMKNVSASSAKRFVKYWLACRKRLLIYYPNFQAFDAKDRKIHAPITMLKALTDDDIVEIFNKIDTENIYGVRLYVLLQLLLNTGMRIDEALNVKIRDILWDEHFILLSHTKGSKERKVPLNVQLSVLLDFYIKEVRGESELPYLFLSSSTSKLSYSAVKSYCRRHLIPKLRLSPGRKFYFHAFRIKFATEYLKKGGTIVSLQLILGHSRKSIETTMGYVRLANEDITYEDITRVNFFQK